MSIRRLVYVANVRLPTEKAHGFQICKMCEAFADQGPEVLLLHPYRFQRDSSLKNRSVYDYYGIRRNFTVRSTLNIDVSLLNLFLSDRAFAPIYLAHSLLWGLYAAPAARRRGARVCFTRDITVACGLLLLGLPTIYECHAIPRKAQRYLLHRIAGHPALRMTVALTHAMRRRLLEEEGFPGSRTIVLPDGVDLSVYEELPEKRECRRMLGLPPDRPILGYLGRFRTLEMEKGIPDMVKAMARLRSHLGCRMGVEPLLLCVGGPPECIPAYLELARRAGVPEGAVMFADRVPNRDTVLWVRAFDIALMPWPSTEHLACFASPLKLFEYMASGVPILATDLPAVREILNHNENAWLVEPGNPEALADGASVLLADETLGRRLADRAAADVVQYTWLKRTRAILDNIEHSIRSSGPFVHSAHDTGLVSAIDKLAYLPHSRSSILD